MVALVSGCSPVVISTTPRMVVIGNARAANTAETNQLAEQECQKQGKHAMYVPDSVPDEQATFECGE